MENRLPHAVCGIHCPAVCIQMQDNIIRPACGSILETQIQFAHGRIVDVLHYVYDKYSVLFLSFI